MVNLFKTQFTAGEISPSLWGRVDSAVFQSGASRLRNVYVRPHGSVVNRAGTLYIGTVRDVPEHPQVRLIPFQYSDDDTYVIELTHLKMRVIRDGGYVLATEVVDGERVTLYRSLYYVSQDTVAIFTTTSAHGFADGDHVQIGGVADMGELNGRVLVVLSHTADTLVLGDFDGTPLDTSAFGEYIAGESGGRIYKVFQKTLAYTGDQLSALRYDQRKNVMTLVHPDHPPRYLTRQDHSVWRIDDVVFEPTLSPPPTVWGSSTHKVKVDIDGITTEEEGKISFDDAQTSVAHNSAGYLRNTGEMIEMEDRLVLIGKQVDSTHQTYEILDQNMKRINTSSYTPYTSLPPFADPPIGTFEGDTLYRYIVTSVDEDEAESRPSGVATVISKALSALTDADKPFPKIILEWDEVPNAVSYRVYRQKEIASGSPEVGAPYGYCGTVKTTVFVDQNTSPDFTRQPPEENNPFLEKIIEADLFHILRTNPAQFITKTAHGLVVGDTAKVYDVFGMLEMNGITGVVAEVLSSTSFTMTNVVDGTPINAEDNNAFALNITDISNANPAVISTNGTHNFKLNNLVIIDSAEGMTEINGIVCKVMSYTDNTLKLRRLSNDTVINSTSWGTYTGGGRIRSYTGKIQRRNPRNSPSATCYYQQRKVYGGSEEGPQTLWFSKAGQYDTMDKSPTVIPDDAITLGIDSMQVNKIKHIIPLSTLLVLTAGGIYKVAGGQSTAITASDAQASPQDATGASDITPLVLGTDVIYVGRGNKTINSIGYTFTSDQYQADDIIVRAKHLFTTYGVKEIAGALVPDNLVVAVREDGKILFLTYMKSTNVIAWAWGDTGTNDKFESVCSIVENGEDVVYVVVTRLIQTKHGAKFRKYVERFFSRAVYVDKDNIPEPRSLTYVDSAVVYNGEGNTAGAAIKAVTNLHHLEGREVAIIADGNVLPNQVVTNGQVTLARSATYVVVGLPYTSEIHTLPVDTGNGTISAEKKRINSVTLRLDKTYGVEVSVNNETYFSQRSHLKEVNLDKLPLLSGDMFLQMLGHHDRSGIVYLRQTAPLPCEVLGVIPDVTVNDRNYT